MIGLKLPSKKRVRDEAEKPFWISFADLMMALMVLFLVATTVVISSMKQNTDDVTEKKTQRDHDIQELIAHIADIAKNYPGVEVRGHSINFGDKGKFESGSHLLSAEKETLLRSFIPEVLSAARTPSGDKWIKRIVVEGFADKTGAYLPNLHLSLQRSERVLCALLASPESVADALTDEDRLQTRKLFLVGGSSFNAPKENYGDSRRIELRLEFLEIGENRQAPRDAPLDNALCPLDSR